MTVYRDIYYKDPALFKTQSTVDRIVDDIAYSFHVPRATLNVVDQDSLVIFSHIAKDIGQIASAKGLVAGPITTLRDGHLIPDGQIKHEACRCLKLLCMTGYLHNALANTDTELGEYGRCQFLLCQMDSRSRKRGWRTIQAVLLDYAYRIRPSSGPSCLLNFGHHFRHKASCSPCAITGLAPPALH